jgi:hypothetical protein
MEESMRTVPFGFVAGFACVVVLWPIDAATQSEIAGVVKDASGSVLPGVTVEAASPALIEEMRAGFTSKSPSRRGIRTTMPLDVLGRLSRQQNADVIAFMLKANGWPAGVLELSRDLPVLKQIC